MAQKDIKIGGEWQTVVAPVIANLKLAAAINQHYTFKSAGAGALAKLLEDMAKKLDIAAAYITELEKERPNLEGLRLYYHPDYYDVVAEFALGNNFDVLYRLCQGGLMHSVVDYDLIGGCWFTAELRLNGRRHFVGAELNRVIELEPDDCPRCYVKIRPEGGHLCEECGRDI